METERECKRCGACCMQIGTMWSQSEHPLIKPLARLVIAHGVCSDGPEPCDMLLIKDGQAVCLIEKYFGWAAKPKICLQYPEDGENCHRMNAFEKPQGTDPTKAMGE